MSETASRGMRPLTSVIPLEEAQARLAAAIRPVDRVERVHIAAAAGRVLAEDIDAPMDVPGFARAAMDGYAVRAADLAAASADMPTLLAPVGESRPGALPTVACTPGTCVAIATGAPLPEGADAVVMVERTEQRDARVAFFEPPTPRQHVSPRGHDVQAGATVLRQGMVLTPGRVGLLATLGLAELLVVARPVVAIVSSGDELLDPGAAPVPGRVYDANRFTLDAICREHGAETRLLPPVRDELAAWHAALEAAAGADLLVSSGGSSAGERDLLVDVIRSLGEVLFHGIAVKPGMPTLGGRLGQQLVLGMPGNPTSCLSNAYVLLIPTLRALAGLPPHVPDVRQATLTQQVTSPASRLQFYQVRLDDDRAEPVFKGSGDITSLAEADGYIEVPVGVDRLEAGTRVEVKRY